MVDTTPFNKFVTQHGGPESVKDENPMIEYEDGDVKAYWVSVYGSPFIKAPKGLFTKNYVYQDFCVEVAKMIPPWRSREKFHEFMNQCLAEATVRETLPGMEEGAVVRDAIFSTLWRHRTGWQPYKSRSGTLERYCDYDDDERVHRSVEKGDPAFIETRPEGPGYPEMFIRINALMDAMTFLQSQGVFERRITREEVANELRKMSRPPYPRTGVSPRGDVSDSAFYVPGMEGSECQDR